LKLTLRFQWYAWPHLPLPLSLIFNEFSPFLLAVFVASVSCLWFFSCEPSNSLRCAKKLAGFSFKISAHRGGFCSLTVRKIPILGQENVSHKEVLSSPSEFSRMLEL
jgi:hypothetical protein